MAAYRVYNSVAASDRENHLPSFGAKLKTEREKRAITLDQISGATKIGTRMLQALEEENFDVLPGGIFNKGFVRAYARFVGIDEDQAVADYLEASGEGPVLPPDEKLVAEIAAAKASQSRPVDRQIQWEWLAGGLLVIALALFLWSRSHRKPEETQPAETASQTTGGAVARSEGSHPTNPAPTPVSAPQTSTPQAKVATPTPLPVATKSQVTPGQPSAAASPGEFTLIILAREDSWISASADGKALFEDTLIAESQRAVHARNEITIKAGNVGALDFVFNGKKLPSQGDYGEVKTLGFNPNGLLPQAPSKPSTP